MATTKSEFSINGGVGTQWPNLGGDESGLAWEPSATQPLAGNVQITGTLGGATVVFQGSNDGFNYVTLKDVFGNDLTFSAAGAADFSTAMRYIRPTATGGTGSSIVVTAVLRG